MSKRLRASLRASNKGRSLRPKTAQMRVSSFTPLPPAGASEAHEEHDRVSDTPLPAPEQAVPFMEAHDSLGDALQKSSEREPVPPSDLRARETVREPLNGESKVARAAAGVEVKNEPPKVTPPSVRVASRVFNAETKPFKPELRAPRTGLPPEPAPIASVAEKSPAPKAAKTEEPAANRKDAEEPAPKEEAHASLADAPDDELDLLSVSAEFFRREEEESVPPAAELHTDVEDAPKVVVMSPAALARRARLRRVVAGVVAFAGVISLAVVGKTLAASKRGATPVAKPPVVQQEANLAVKDEPAPAPEAQKPTEAAQVEAKAPEKAEAKPDDAKAAEPQKAEAKPDDTKAAEPQKADDAKAAEPQKAEAKPDDAKAAEKADDAKATEAQKAEPSADVATLKKETLSLLNRGRNKDAIVKAREALAIDPSDALLYLYLGSALQDSGKWKEGVEAYSECVRHATKGPIHECHQMGGRK